MESVGEPELLWPLLLAQIVYDELSRSSNVDFGTVATTYRNHPLLPEQAPLLNNAASAEQLYADLLKEHNVDTSLDRVVQAQNLAEPLYATFCRDLLERMQNDVIDFESAYRSFEEFRGLPQDERLVDEQT